jgi:hypothetical protein
MDVYVEYSEGSWWAVAVETGEKVAKAWLYHSIRARCRERGYSVVAVRRRSV